MNHYPHHIGDFNNATRHSTRVERSLYRDIMDWYYDSEKPIPAGDFEYIARRLLATSEEEKQALRVVLGEFFTLDDGFYRNARCDKEILRYQSLIASASRAGKASAERRLNASSTPVERPMPPRSTNQNQNQNQEPIEKRGKPSPSGSRLALDSLPLDWHEFAIQENPNADPSVTFAKFSDHWKAQVGAKGRKADWEATWRNWVRREKEFAPRGQQSYDYSSVIANFKD